MPLSRFIQPSLGSLEWAPLYRGVADEEGPDGKIRRLPSSGGVTIIEELAGVEAAIRYVGTEALDTLNAQRAQIDLEEAQRLARLRAGLDPTAAQAIKATPENEKALSGYLADGLRALVPEVRDTVTGDHVVGEEAQAFLRTLPFGDRFRLLLLAMAAQGVSRRAIFRSAGAGNAQAGGDPPRGG